MAGTEYVTKIDFEGFSPPFPPPPVYFVMNVARFVLYEGQPTITPLGNIEKMVVEGHGIVKDEASRDRYFYLQFCMGELPPALEDTLEMGLLRVSICSPNFSSDRGVRIAQQMNIENILKATGDYTWGMEYQLLKTRWYERRIKEIE